MTRPGSVATILLGWMLCFGKANHAPPPNTATPRVTISQGTLIGGIGTDIRGGNYYYFQGIPYAKPPIGPLRFKAPVPPLPWSGIRNATQLGSACIGRDILGTYEIIGSEDCLVLNVYTKGLPSNNNGALRPVLFFIHGGGFIFGSAGTEFYGPEFLLTEDIVLVTTNYRLGLLGFLSLENPALGVPGNGGLKDMVLALKWARQNIASFGGDPNSVTIFGESGGALAVHLLALSPLASGLFSKVIAESGTALNPWALGVKGVDRITKALNVSGASETTIYNYLAQLPAEQIFAIQEQIVDIFIPALHRYLGYVVETNSPGAFLTETPLNIILSGNFNQIPIIFGYNSLEGLYVILFSQPISVEQPYFFINAIPWNWGYRNGSQQSQQVGQQIKDYYYGNQQPGPNNTITQYVVMNDAFFLYSIHQAITLHARVSRAPVYFYRMSIDTQLNTGKVIGGITLPGVCHFDDIGYLFQTYVTPVITPGSIEDVSSRRFVKLWTNFARTGNPTPQPNDPVLQVDWNPTRSNPLTGLDIGQTLNVIPFLEINRINFWQNLYDNSPAGTVE